MLHRISRLLPSRHSRIGVSEPVTAKQKSMDDDDDRLQLQPSTYILTYPPCATIKWGQTKDEMDVGYVPKDSPVQASPQYKHAYMGASRSKNAHR